MWIQVSNSFNQKQRKLHDVFVCFGCHLIYYFPQKYIAQLLSKLQFLMKPKKKKYRRTLADKSLDFLTDYWRPGHKGAPESKILDRFVRNCEVFINEILRSQQMKWNADIYIGFSASNVYTTLVEYARKKQGNCCIPRGNGVSTCISEFTCPGFILSASPTFT